MKEEVDVCLKALRVMRTLSLVYKWHAVLIIIGAYAGQVSEWIMDQARAVAGRF